MKDIPQKTLLTAGIFALAGLLLFSYGAKQFILAQSSESWPTTEGKVTASSVKQTTEGTQAKQRSKYSAEVIYQFSVDGQSYESDRLSFGGDFMSRSYSDIESIVARYPVGAVVTVHYRASNPKLSVIEAGSDLMNGVFPLVGLAFLGGGLSRVFKELRRRNGGRGLLVGQG